MKPILWLLPLTTSLLGTGCSIGTTLARQINEDWQEIIDRRNSQYTLKDGDQLEIKIYPDVEGALNQTALILPDGRTDLFFLPDHRAAGKSVQEFSSDFQRGLSQEITGSEVSVQVTPRVEQIHMVGEWTNAATYPLTARMTLRDAVALAGGDRLTGRPWKIELTRPYSNPLKPQRYTIDLWDTDEEVFLLPGDIIENERNAVAFVIAVLREYIFGIIPTQLYGGAIGGALL